MVELGINLQPIGSEVIFRCALKSTKDLGVFFFFRESRDRPGKILGAGGGSWAES